MKVVKKF